MKKKPLISALEPRILFDGAAVATAADTLDNSSFYNAPEDNSAIPAAVESSPSNDKKEIAFVDSGVEDYQTLIDGLDSSIEVYILDGTQNGLDQIASILEGKNDIDAMHILSHGSTGEITIGNSVLNAENLSSFEQTLQDIGNSLTQDGDILLYGCNVGANGEGESFVDAIANATSADVAASDDITGAQSLGGDWELEYDTGVIDVDDLNIDK